MGNFTAELEDHSIKNLCKSFDLTRLLNKPTCLKNPKRPSYTG